MNSEDVQEVQEPSLFGKAIELGGRNGGEFDRMCDGRRLNHHSRRGLLDFVLHFTHCCFGREGGDDDKAVAAREAMPENVTRAPHKTCRFLRDGG